jgi:hypothetical protein
MCTNAGTCEEEKRLHAIQEHAWRWFAYHAAQRTSMFNYFLAAAALLVAGFAAMAGDRNWTLAGVISVLGFVMSLCFAQLDHRNKTLVSLGEKVIDAFEQAVFRNGAGTGLTLKGVQFPAGIHTCDTRTHTGRVAGTCEGFWRGEHGILLPVIEYIVALAFFVGAVLAFTSPVRLESKASKADAAARVQLVDDLRALNESIGHLTVRVRDLEQSLKTITTPAGPTTSGAP